MNQSSKLAMRPFVGLVCASTVLLGTGDFTNAAGGACRSWRPALISSISLTRGARQPRVQ
jgi:hypothetical protein